MLLGGLWHGANWTFVCCENFHGLLLAGERAIGKTGPLSRTPMVMQRAVTFVLVMIGWVMFRAVSVPQALDVYAGMLGIHGHGMKSAGLITWSLPVLVMPFALLLVWMVPNTWQIRHDARWHWTAILALLFVISVLTMLVNSASPFLYFQF